MRLLRNPKGHHKVQERERDCTLIVCLGSNVKFSLPVKESLNCLESGSV